MKLEDVIERIQDALAIPPSAAIPAVVLGIIVLAAASSYRTFIGLLKPYFSPLRALKGPESASFLMGHLLLSREVDTPGLWQQQQVEKYGNVLVYKGWMNTDRLLTTDAKAIQHVLTNSMIYRKPEEVRYNLGALLGEGLLFAEGHDHKRQRRVMNPAFGMLHLRDMTEIFVEKSRELCDALTSLTKREQQDGWTSVEILSYLSCTTLDIIGLAGFNYSFDSVQHRLDNSTKESELSHAFSKVMAVTEKGRVLIILKMFFPIFRLITWDDRSKRMKNSERTIREIGTRLVREKRSALLSSQEKGKSKDLLTLLIKASMNEGGENGDRSMSDDEVMQQIPTFLIAGHETTSTSTTWALYSLATHPEIQTRLRKELLSISSEAPTMDELNSLPYLEYVVREVLRYHSVVPGTVRIAGQDDIIPVDTPYTDKYGKIHHEIQVAAGDGIFIPVRIMNHLKEIWGEDADEFNPDRWINPPKASSSIPGVWGNQLSFLGGPRSCIGFRFALVEMKALLFELVRTFEFKLAVPADEVIGKMNIVTRPILKSQLGKGNQLPVLIRRVKDIHA